MKEEGAALGQGCSRRLGVWKAASAETKLGACMSRQTTPSSLTSHSIGTMWGLIFRRPYGHPPKVREAYKGILTRYVTGSCISADVYTLDRSNVLRMSVPWKMYKILPRLHRNSPVITSFEYRRTI
jgi:hypothetical protein